VHEFRKSEQHLRFHVFINEHSGMHWSACGAHGSGGCTLVCESTNPLVGTCSTDSPNCATASDGVKGQEKGGGDLNAADRLVRSAASHRPARCALESPEMP
jgi:hypothetical protein